MVKKFWGFIKDPLYGYIQLNESERRIIDCYPMQRLRRIKQLAGSEFVYPAANHTRFEHSLGAMYLAGVLGENLPIELKEDEIQKIKFAALLHDIGHGPLSHIFESFLTRFRGKTHEDMTVEVIEDSEIADILGEEGFTPKRLSKLAIGKLRDSRKPFLDDVIVGAVDVDKMDFVSRDSYHTGAGYGYTDIFRLIYTMDICKDQLMVNATAVPTLETFLIARLESFKTIYFHKASRAVQIMLVKAIECAHRELEYLHFQNADEYLKLDDYLLWYELKHCSSSQPIINQLEQRKLLKCAYEKTLYSKERLVTSIFSNEAVRKEVEEEIARKATIDVTEVTIDTPSLPSVPYSHKAAEPMDIPVSFCLPDGKRKIRKVTELSRIINVLRVYLNIVRIYTIEKYRTEVKKAAEDVLGTLPSETMVAY